MQSFNLYTMLAFNYGIFVGAYVYNSGLSWKRSLVIAVVNMVLMPLSLGKIIYHMIKVRKFELPPVACSLSKKKNSSN